VNTSTRKKEDITILDCSGRIGGDGVAQWRSAIMKELDGGAKALLINLTDLEFFSLDAATAFRDIANARLNEKYNARIALLLPNTSAAFQPLGNTGLLDVFPYFPSERDAVASL
jgi:anti-anti-sigma factor